MAPHHGRVWQREFGSWLRPFVAALGHAARRRWAQVYLQGLLAPGERKSVRPLAARVATSTMFVGTACATGLTLMQFPSLMILHWVFAVGTLIMTTASTWMTTENEPITDAETAPTNAGN